MLRSDNDPWLVMQVLRCTEGPGYAGCVARAVHLYVSVSSSNVHTARVYLVALDKAFYRLHVYCKFDYWVMRTIFRCGFKTHEYRCCFIY